MTNKITLNANRYGQRFLFLILDGLLLINFLVILIILLTGGWSGQIWSIFVSAHSIENPSLTFTLFLMIRLVTKSDPQIPIFFLANQLKKVLYQLKALNGKRPFFCLFSLIIFYFFIITTIVILRHLSFNSGYDLGIFQQVFWSLIHGKGLWSSILGRQFLGEHFSPILYFLGTGYLLWPNTEYLLVLQTAVLCLGAFPLWLLARKELKSEHWAILFSFLYLCYQPMRNVNLADFHEIAITTLLLLIAFYFLNNKKYKSFLFLLVLAILCKEEITEIAFILGCYIVFFHKKRFFGASIAFGGIIGFFILTFWVIPFFRGGPFPFVDRYSYLGNNIFGIVQTFFTKPFFVLSNILTIDRLDYFWRVFGPLGFVSLLSPSHLLLTIPTFFQNVLSNYGFQYSIKGQYTAPLIPFVFISAIFGVKNLLNRDSHPLWARKITRSANSSFIFVTLIIFTSIHFGESPVYQLLQYLPSTKENYVRREIIKKIPSSASVSAQNSYVPHLANREFLYLFPKISNSEYIVLDSSTSKWPLDNFNYLESVKKLSSINYLILSSRGTLLIFHQDLNSGVRGRDSK
jgi:uncharacterized membrane protein